MHTYMYTCTCKYKTLSLEDRIGHWHVGVHQPQQPQGTELRPLLACERNATRQIININCMLPSVLKGVNAVRTQTETQNKTGKNAI